MEDQRVNHRDCARAQKLIQLLLRVRAPENRAEEGGLSRNKRHSPEQIVRKLRQADEKLASGASLPEVARELGISEATYHRCWRNRYGRMNPSETKRLKELEKENARLKKLWLQSRPWTSTSSRR